MALLLVTRGGTKRLWSKVQACSGMIHSTAAAAAAAAAAVAAQQLLRRTRAHCCSVLYASLHCHWLWGGTFNTNSLVVSSAALHSCNTGCVCTIDHQRLMTIYTTRQLALMIVCKYYSLRVHMLYVLMCAGQLWYDEIFDIWLLLWGCLQSTPSTSCITYITGRNEEQSQNSSFLLVPCRTIFKQSLNSVCVWSHGIAQQDHR